MCGQYHQNRAMSLYYAILNSLLLVVACFAHRPDLFLCEDPDGVCPTNDFSHALGNDVGFPLCRNVGRNRGWLEYL